MSQKRNPRSISVTPKGIRRLNQARASQRDHEGKPLTDERLAPRAKLNGKIVQQE
ncbi:MAG: hypothetical protein F6J94_01055 [Moorea sp. SIO1F2]|uniref:hypothetical protein n=1 Tax=Moorena sp. SIO1F2 TaxID=2607819 RepID=UPI0013BCE1F4|nr:hypothetical protein [Moorena sp. SIO1F2]NET80621.1 hypothetical protein [Moorena sp. SIO1F2]